MASLKKKLFSHRDVNLYFEGYDKQEVLDADTGRKKVVYRYTGDYFLFRTEEGGFRRFKLQSALFTLGGSAAFVASALLGPEASVTAYMGLPSLFSLIPLCYLLLGLFGMLRHGSEKMTIREYFFGMGRMRNSLWGVVALWAFCDLGHIYYIVKNGCFQPVELLCLGLELLATVLLIMQWRTQELMETKCIRRAKSKYEKDLESEVEESGKNGE